MTDPIADMLTRIRNALARRKAEVILPFSKIKFAIAKILEKEKFFEKVEKEKENCREMKIVLKYDEEGKSAIRSLRRISKPGRRIYSNRRDMPRVYEGLGVTVISTSRGLMIDKEARRRKLGGEVICEVY